MSLNKFTDTSVKDWLKIGADHIVANRFSLDGGGDIVANSNYTVGFINDTYLLPMGLTPNYALLNANTRYGNGGTDLEEWKDNAPFGGVKFLSSGMYRVSASLEFTPQAPLDNVEFFLGSTFGLEPILARSGVSSFSTPQMVYINVSTIVQVNASTSDISLFVKKDDGGGSVNALVSRWSISVDKLSSL